MNTETLDRIAPAQQDVETGGRVTLNHVKGTNGHH